MLSASAQEIARQEIKQRLNEYCWGYDRNDMALLASVLTDDAISGGRVVNAAVSWGLWHGRAEIVNGLSLIRNSQPDRRRHAIGTFIFDSLSAYHATARAYASLFSYANGQPPHLVALGEYSLTASKGDDGWRLQRLVEVMDSPF